MRVIIIVIGIDIDDTLTNTFDYLLPYVAQYYGASEDELRKQNISYNTLPEEWNKRQTEFFKMYFDDIIEHTPFKKDAAWGVEQLHKMGHRIIIITARTDEYYTDVYLTTNNELKNGKIVYDKLVCSLDKTAVCLEEGVQLLIDDTIINCERVHRELGIPCLIMNSKANRNSQTLFPRVSNWMEVLKWIRNHNM